MNRSRSWLLSTLLMLVSGALCAIELDLTFGYAGKSVTPGGAGQSWLYAMAVAPDGSIVVAGQINDHAVIKRFDRRGQPDLTFGAGGVVTGSFGSFQDVALAVAVQPDGRTVIAGVASGPGTRLLVARYLVNGDPDPSFAGAGFVAIDPLGGGAGASFRRARRERKDRRCRICECTGSPVLASRPGGLRRGPLSCQRRSRRVVWNGGAVLARHARSRHGDRDGSPTRRKDGRRRVGFRTPRSFPLRACPAPFGWRSRPVVRPRRSGFHGNWPVFGLLRIGA